MSNNFYTLTLDEIFKIFATRKEGLTDEEVTQRQEQYGLNLLNKEKKGSLFTLFLLQFKSPLILLLLACATLSIFLSNYVDGTIILIIVFLTALLGLYQEKKAFNAMEKLINMVEVKSTVIRNNQEIEVLAKQLVPGDILKLSAGDVIPADCYLLESNHLFINESTLTGESALVEKIPGTVPDNTPIRLQTNSLFMGTYVISGKGLALVTLTGKTTEFGKISESLKPNSRKTAFEFGINQFGYFLMQITFVLVLVIFAVNSYFGRPLIESFLFALALGVGFTPQLLPAIITVNLCRGAKFLAEKKVIVKKLSSIENFGSMNILCCDKTGTLTNGEVQLMDAFDCFGSVHPKTLLYAAVNAGLQAGFINPLDLSILKAKSKPENYVKLDEIPYDFSRKRISLLAKNEEGSVLVTKGAFETILSLCSYIEKGDGQVVEIGAEKNAVLERLQALSAQGYRILAVAYKKMDGKPSFHETDETDLVFLGYLQFSDPVKANIKETLADLKKLGISIKIISGDHHLVVKEVGEKIGLSRNHLTTGSALNHLSDEQLLFVVKKTNLFAEVEPLQKERIIHALRKAGNIVGFLGDGINDASALQAADVGISVENATDVAKEGADFIMLEKDLHVLKEGVKEGRRVFANSMKYVFMATSANFGNMFSMAGASFFLNFLPLLPKQILLTNLLTDIPELTIATDNVDPDLLQHPQRWNIRFVRRFMIVFGLISSIFDFLTFGLLLYFTTSVETFRTGWFIESVLSAASVVLVIRTKKSIFKSRPSTYLTLAVFAIILVTLAIPYTPLSKLFGFTPVSLPILGMIGIIVVLYVITAECAKKIFYSVKRLSS